MGQTDRSRRSCRRRQASPRLALVLALAALGAVGFSTAGCGPTVEKVNGKPDQFYGKSMSVSGRVGDYILRDKNADATVFQLIAGERHRIIVVAPPSARFNEGKKVRVRGEFVRERTVGGRSFYDVLVATSVTRLGFMRRMMPM
jgi:hypothetical protein